MESSNAKSVVQKAEDKKTMNANTATALSTKPKERCSSSGGSEITVKQFLDFLKTAYQV